MQERATNEYTDSVPTCILLHFKLRSQFLSWGSCCIGNTFLFSCSLWWESRAVHWTAEANCSEKIWNYHISFAKLLVFTPWASISPSLCKWGEKRCVVKAVLPSSWSLVRDWCVKFIHQNAKFLWWENIIWLDLIFDLIYVQISNIIWKLKSWNFFFSMTWL